MRPLGYFRLVADKDHVSPGPYERNNTGASWARDQDVRLDFPTLAKALEKVALGEVRLERRGAACAGGGMRRSEWGRLQWVPPCSLPVCPSALLFLPAPPHAAGSHCSSPTLSLQLTTTVKNQEERTFFMTRADM